MFIDSIVPVPSPGAGRTRDLSWPDYLGTMPTNGAAFPIGVVSTGRQGANTPTIQNTQAQRNTGSGGAGFFVATGTGWNGRGALQLVPGTGAFAPNIGVQVQLGPMTMLPNIGAAAANGDQSATDDFACYRAFGIMSYPATNVYGSDIGIEWGAANVGDYAIIGGGACGFGFTQSAADTITFIRRPAVGSASVATVVRQTSAADLLKWHTYEVRLIGARPGSNALLKVLIDGKNVLSLDWITDNLGAPLASNGVFGYSTSLTAYSSGAGSQGLVVQRVRFMIGPTEASLL